MQTRTTGDGRGLPKSWRLGNRANLRQMHDEACAQRVAGDDVEVHLQEAVRGTPVAPLMAVRRPQAQKYMCCRLPPGMLATTASSAT